MEKIEGDAGDKAGGYRTYSGEATQLVDLGELVVYLERFHLRSLRM
jgi:hypothetical protein